MHTPWTVSNVERKKNSVKSERAIQLELSKTGHVGCKIQTGAHHPDMRWRNDEAVCLGQVTFVCGGCREAAPKALKEMHQYNLYTWSSATSGLPCPHFFQPKARP